MTTDKEMKRFNRRANQFLQLTRLAEGIQEIIDSPDYPGRRAEACNAPGDIKRSRDRLVG